MVDQYYIEKRPDGRFDVKGPDAGRASAVVDTQEEGIEAARRFNPDAAIHVERVRDVGDGRDKWRKV